MRWTRTKRVTSLVGLAVEDGRLRASHVTRNKSGLAVAKAAAADLTLDLLHPEAELVGRELRNHLDAAGIRELHRRIVAITSDMVSTPPIPDRLEEIGWTGGECISDSQLQIHYYRTTADGRIGVQTAFRHRDGTVLVFRVDAHVVRWRRVHGHPERRV